MIGKLVLCFIFGSVKVIGFGWLLVFWKVIEIICIWINGIGIIDIVNYCFV